MESKKAEGNLSSPGLRAVIERAKKEYVQSDIIDRAVKKGAGTDSGEMYAVLYEAYGPGGCALLIEGLTDNKNRTVAEIKHLLSKNGGTLAAQGAATWAFTKTEEGWEPNQTIPLSDEDGAILTTIILALEGSDEVQDVYTNAD